MCPNNILHKGTKYFALIALKYGRHHVAMMAMVLLGISAILVSFDTVFYIHNVIMFQHPKLETAKQNFYGYRFH